MDERIYKPGLYPVRPTESLRQMAEDSAALYGNKPAFQVKDRPGGDYRPILYSEVLEDMYALGTALIDSGLKGEKIALMGENRYQWFLSYMAVANGVGIICPLDKELPPAEIRGLLQRSGATAIIYSKKVEASVLEALEGVETVKRRIGMDAVYDSGDILSYQGLIQKGRRLLRKGDRRYLDIKVDPDAMCTLLFTSGTTGNSKGVMLSSRNIVSNVVNMSKVVHVVGKTGLSVLPMHHCYELTCHVMTAFYQGCNVAFCEGLKYITKNMEEAKANVMLGVPLIFETIYKRIWKQAAKAGMEEKMKKALRLSKKLAKVHIHVERKLFDSVIQALGGHAEVFIAGAAPINPTIIENFRAMGINMFQGYGMTECAPIIAVNMDNYSKPASAGLPLPGTEIIIEDPDENGIGEIICKSDSVMLGYYQDPEATAAVLQDGWLRTGDYGRLDEDGFLYVTGRKKNVIVTKNGKNIFPEELEYLLARSDYVQEVMVYGQDDGDGDLLVSADIFPNYPLLKEEMGDYTPAALHGLMDQLVEAVNGQVPPYKRIKRFYLRETGFEKTTTQKIKRHLVQKGSDRKDG